MSFQVSDHRVGYILNKSENATPDCKMMQASKANESVFFDFWLTVKAAPHECIIRTGQP